MHAPLIVLGMLIHKLPHRRMRASRNVHLSFPWGRACASLKFRVKSAPENLSHEARAVIDPANDVYVSVASAWELWLKHAKKPIVAVAPVLNGGASSLLKACKESGIALLE